MGYLSIAFLINRNLFSELRISSIAELKNFQFSEANHLQ
jgi:hypothetical protein